MMTFIPRASHLQRASAAVAVSWAAILSSACSGSVGDDPQANPGSGGSGHAASGGSGGVNPGTGGGNPMGGSGGSGVGGGAGTPGGGSSGMMTGSGGSAGTPMLDPGGAKPRLLTQAEYRASLEKLFGTVAAELDLPPDANYIGGFASIGGAKVAVSEAAATQYEIASRAVVAEVFGDMTRWQALVGCSPQPNLSDTCVETFARAFGRKAFRRDLTDAEFTQWVKVARDAAVLAGNAAQGLSTLTSGFLQSPYFLYRIETNALDPASGRLKYDGPSMAVRLAYFLTGGPPSAELLAAGESGQLDTAEGVRAAAAPMLADDGLVRSLTSLFYEYTQAELVMGVPKSTTMFPEVNDAMRSSMKESVRLFLEKVVLAPGADVRSFYDSNQAFADATLAPFYGVTPPSSGFAQVTFPPTSGRAGILGQAGILFAHGKPDHSSPTIRGLFVARSMLCQEVELPTDLEVPELVMDPTKTTRDNLEAHREAPACAGCHAVFDPMGMALEHFDAIGRYRDTENGLAINATGTLDDGTAFDGAVELGTALRGHAPAIECLLRHFYRGVNGRTDDMSPVEKPQVDAMVASLNARNFVFRDLVADFVASDAFRSAPALPITGESQ
jgi:hypothetical protein